MSPFTSKHKYADSNTYQYKEKYKIQCYFILGIGDSIGGAQLTMEEVWIVQTGNFTLNGLVLLLFCNFFGKVKVVLEPQDMLADLIRVLAFA